MEERNIKITLDTAKEWYQKGGTLRDVALQAFSKQELEDNRSHSWEAFCANHNTVVGYASDLMGNILPGSASFNNIAKKVIYPSLEYAEAARALCQLLQLRQEWIGDWEPDWEDSQYKYMIFLRSNNLSIVDYMFIQRPLSFPTRKMAEEFFNDFKDLILIAKPLL